MANSRRFNQLEKRLKELENFLLPAIKLSGNYSKKELDSTRAYCVLCHAEIESFLEDVALKKVDETIASWVAQGRLRVTQIIFYLVTYCDKAPANKSNPPNSLVHISHNNYRSEIKGNHGVRQQNIDNLFAKIGYAFDNTLALTLDSFAQQRGEIAHTSIKTQQPIDPQTEKNRITLILAGLKFFDQDFSKHR